MVLWPCHDSPVNYRNDRDKHDHQRISSASMYYICLYLRGMKSGSWGFKIWLIICLAVPFSGVSGVYVPPDTTYIKSYKNTLCISIPLTAKSLILRFRDNVNLRKLIYMPSPAGSFGIDFDTQLLSLSVSPAFFNIKTNPGRYGKSTYQDIQLSLYPSFLVIDMTLQSYDGYFLQNSRQFNEYKGQGVYQRPDMSAISGGLQFLYCFNRKHFSFSAPFSYCSTQLKSAGSMMAGIGGSAFGLSNDSGIVGANVRNKFISDLNYTDVKSFRYGASFGYGYTFVFKKNLFLAAYIIPGIGVASMLNTRMDSTTYRMTNRLSYDVNYRLALGYDNRKWYGGAYCVFHDYYFNQAGHEETDYSNLKIKVYAGCRFDFSKLKHKVISALTKS
jgi:hypothetical protein